MQRPGWTVETILAHLMALREADILRIEQRFLAQKEAIQVASVAAEHATNKVAIAMERRFESVNEFRGNLKDNQATYVTRNEMYSLVAAASGFCGLIGGVVGHFIR